MLDPKHLAKAITEGLGHRFYSVWTPTLDKSDTFKYPAAYWGAPRKGLFPSERGVLKNRWSLQVACYDQTGSKRTTEQRDLAHANSMLLAEKIIYNLKHIKNLNGVEYDWKFISAEHTNEWDDPNDGTHGVVYEIVMEERAPICHPLITD